MSPPTRFCSSCGAPAPHDASHCARCGAVLAVPPVAAAAASTASGGEEGRSRANSLVVGLVACLGGSLLFLVCGGIVAAIGIPSFLAARTGSKVEQAERNLKALWDAERAWALAHDGEFLEFYVDAEQPDDPNLRRLKVDLGTLHYSYEGYYDGDVFTIAAAGNVDEDDSLDEWEITSDHPVPFHVYDDIRERDRYGERYASGYDEHDPHPPVDLPEELAGEEGVAEGGVVGGIGGTGPGNALSDDLAIKSSTARTNLIAIWEGQQLYKQRKKSFMSFDRGGPATWTALGLTGLPAAQNHRYAATVSVSGDELTLTATANLDDDAFEDLWTLSSVDGRPLQIKNDALNVDLSEILRLTKKDAP